MILLISFIGGIASRGVLPLPVPASVYGFAILFIGLLSGVIKLAHVKDTGKLLIEIMPVMFIPAGVGLLESWPQIAPIGVPVAVITLVSTVIVMVISGKITQFVIHKEAQRKLLPVKQRRLDLICLIF